MKLHKLAFAALLLSRSSRSTAQDIGGNNNTAYIVGGTPVTDFDSVRGFAYLANLVAEDVVSGTPFCGGQLIHPDIVLTAAHCWGGFFLDEARTTLDPTTRVLISPLPDGFVEIRSVDAFVPHEDYIFNDFDKTEDIAVVLLNTPSEEPTTTWSTDTTKPAGGDELRIVGFGLTDGAEETFPDNALETTYPGISNENCRADFVPDLFDAGQACARDEDLGSTACNGDSGGACIDTATNEIVGLVSFGIAEVDEVTLEVIDSCPPGGVLVMTRVSNYDAWIRGKINELSQVTPDPPSQAPTLAPADAPTQAPTLAPADAPTPAPTLAPADAPPTQAPATPPTPDGGIGIFEAAALAVISAIVAFIIGDMLDDGCLFGNGEKDNSQDSRNGWCIF